MNQTLSLLDYAVFIIYFIVVAVYGNTIIEDLKFGK